MSFPMSETDYKPWASLGAVYQAENAADSQDMRQHELLKAAFENNTNPLKFQMEMQDKQAQAEYYRAMATKMGTENQDRYADKLARAEETKRLGTDRTARTQLEGILNAARTDRNMDITPILDQLLPNLPQDVRTILNPAPNVSMYNDQSLETAIRLLQERDPEAAKTLRTTMAQQGQTDRNDATIASKERIAQWMAETKSKIEQMKKAGKKDEMKYMAAEYLRLSLEATDPNEKAAYGAMHRTTLEAMKEVAAAGAVAGPAAKAEETRKTLEGIMSGRDISGKIGGDKVTNSQDQQSFKVGDRGVKDGITYERKADGKWYPVSN